jgi:hypothetical protein
MGIEIKPTATACPCLVCARDKEYESRTDDFASYLDMRKECQRTCEIYAYYQKYGINSYIQPDPVEMDHLITVIAELLCKVECGGLGADDEDRLDIWSRRLSVIVNMEETKISTAISVLKEARMIRGGADT